LNEGENEKADAPGATTDDQSWNAFQENSGGQGVQRPKGPLLEDFKLFSRLQEIGHRRGEKENPEKTCRAGDMGAGVCRGICAFLENLGKVRGERTAKWGCEEGSESTAKGAKEEKQDGQDFILEEKYRRTQV